MVRYSSIQEYINYLIENQINVNIIDFVKEVNKLEFKIDINFIDEFIELVSKKECCIHHNMLQKYKISSLNGTTNDIKKILNQNNFEENKDFELRNVSQLRSQGGTSIKNEYYLHPRAFKICLMRSLKTRIYANYYLLLEECIKYYNDYQIELKEKYIIKLKKKNKIIIKIKDDKIDKLEEKINTLLEDNKITKKYNEEIIKRSKKMELQLNETLEKLDITNDKLDDANEELEDINEKLDIAVEDRVIKTKKLATLEYFVIMKNNTTDYKYYIIRGQKRYINKKKDQLEGYDQIKILECVPNASTLWNLMKEKIKNKIDFCGNKLNLINIEENEFLTRVDEIYNIRKEVKLPLFKT